MDVAPDIQQVKDRITAIKQVRLGTIADNPRNPKSHPEKQGEAIKGVVREVGWAGVPLVYPSERLGGKLAFVDGHLRKREFPDLRVRVAVTDLTDAEADYLLLTYDPIASLAMVEREKMAELLDSVEAQEAAVREMLAGLAGKSGLGWGYGQYEAGIEGENIDFEEEWQGMPEFEQEDKQGIIVRVHFLNEDDKREFFQKIEVPFTDRTNSIWYPERPEEIKNQLGTGLVYTDES